jgi:hypothetical protein
VERPALSRWLVLAALAALVLVASAGAATGPIATVTQTIVGLADIEAGGFEPPDVQVAAGPGFVVEMVNLAERTWRTGNGSAQVAQTRPLASFFGSASGQLTDPRILYDAASGRWLASISDIGAASVLLAVSSTSDPTGAWTVSSYKAPGCADQPRLGLTDVTIVLAADIFRNCTENGAQPIGSEVWIVNKQELLAGAKTPDFATYGPAASISSLAPAQSLSPTGTDYAVSADEPTSRVVHLYAIDGIPPAAVTVKEIATPAITRLVRPQFAAQPATPAGRPQQPIDTNDERVLDSIWENGRLWFTNNTSCVPAGDVLLHACARVVELSTATGTVTRDDNLSQPGANLFYPTVRPDSAGNLVIVYGESSEALNPEVVAVGRAPDGTFTDPVVIAQSPGAYLGDRYGDYFGAARDPVDPGLVWVAGEAGTTVVGGRGWATVVASVSVTPAGETPRPVLGAAPTGVRAVHVSARGGRPVRLVYRALTDGAGVRTVIVVRSPAHVVFTTTTPVATLRGGKLYTVDWLPPTKLRGTFSYCAHSITPAGAPSPQSCSTVTLR